MIKYFLTGILFCATVTANTWLKESKASGLFPPDVTNADSLKALLLADPAIFFDNDTFYLYGTRAVNEGFEVYTSTDLKTWKKETSLALSKEDVYGDKGFWAPQVFKYKDTYYMAYTANEHIALAKSKSPLGPFKQTIKSPFQTGIRAIDPFIFIDEDGQKYLYFVRLEQGNRLFVAKLEEDFSDIIPGTVVACLNAVMHPQSWENEAKAEWTVTEGPTVLKHHSKYYLFYSANDFRNINYAVGYAVSESPLGPWEKNPSNPILDKSLISQNGPGHGDFFKDKTGQYYYVFHTHYSGNEVAPRKTAIVKGAFVAGKGRTDQMKFDRNSFYYLQGE